MYYDVTKKQKAQLSEYCIFWLLWQFLHTKSTIENNFVDIGRTMQLQVRNVSSQSISELPHSVFAKDGVDDSFTWYKAFEHFDLLWSLVFPLPMSKSTAVVVGNSSRGTQLEQVPKDFTIKEAAAKPVFSLYLFLTFQFS